MKLAWKYFIPLVFFLIGVNALLGDPNKRILASVPIIPGEHQVEIALTFFAVGILLGLIVYRYEKNKAGRGD